MRNDSNTLDIYCDESCHLCNGQSKVMSIGAVYITRNNRSLYKSKLREIKAKYNMTKELKWSNVSLTKVDMYKDIIDTFVKQDNIGFRFIVVKDKDIIEESANDNEYHEWYNKMYYQLLVKLTEWNCYYNIFIDNDSITTKENKDLLRDILCNTHYDFSQHYIRNIEEVNSKDNDFIQIIDFFTGLITYYHRGLYNEESADRAKKEIVDYLIDTKNICLDKSTPPFEKFFNIFLWRKK